MEHSGPVRPLPLQLPLSWVTMKTERLPPALWGEWLGSGTGLETCKASQTLSDPGAGLWGLSPASPG